MTEVRHTAAAAAALSAQPFETFKGVTEMYLMHEELARARLRERAPQPPDLRAERLRLVAARRRQRRAAALRRLRAALGR